MRPRRGQRSRTWRGASRSSGASTESARCASRSGNIATEGLDGYGPERVAEWEREVPLGRLGTPEEAAALIAFLASPGGGYVTGTTVVMDGGLDV